MGSVLHHIGEAEDSSFVRQRLGLCGVNCLGRVVPPCGEAFYLLKLARSTLASDPDAPLPYLIKSEHHPWQQVNCLADEDQIAVEGIARRIVAFLGAGRFEDEWVGGKRLASEEGTVIRDRGFKAFGIHAFLREPAPFRALLCIADAGDPAEDIAEPAAEDVAFVSGHLQGFTDGVGEVVVGKVEVWEHGGGGVFISLLAHVKN